MARRSNRKGASDPGRSWKPRWSARHVRLNLIKLRAALDNAILDGVVPTGKAAKLRYQCSRHIRRLEVARRWELLPFGHTVRRSADQSLPRSARLINECVEFLESAVYSGTEDMIADRSMDNRVRAVTELLGEPSSEETR